VSAVYGLWCGSWRSCLDLKGLDGSKYCCLFYRHTTTEDVGYARLVRVWSNSLETSMGYVLLHLSPFSLCLRRLGSSVGEVVCKSFVGGKVSWRLCSECVDSIIRKIDSIPTILFVYSHFRPHFVDGYEWHSTQQRHIHFRRVRPRLSDR
jgi:hypothetical protein